LALVLVAVLCATGATGSSIAASQSRPNIVFVLTDDLSGNLLTPRFMPNVWALTGAGTSFSNIFS
jgi:N-acetylglucosamine-6-sulfatase